MTHRWAKCNKMMLKPNKMKALNNFTSKGNAHRGPVLPVIMWQVTTCQWPVAVGASWLPCCGKVTSYSSCTQHHSDWIIKYSMVGVPSSSDKK